MVVINILFSSVSFQADRLWQKKFKPSTTSTNCFTAISKEKKDFEFQSENFKKGSDLKLRCKQKRAKAWAIFYHSKSQRPRTWHKNGMCSFDWQGSRSKQEKSSSIWAEVTKHGCKLGQILRLPVINFSTFFWKCQRKQTKLTFFACEWEILKKDHHQGKQCILVSFHWNGHTLRFYPQTQKLEPLFTA